MARSDERGNRETETDEVEMPPELGGTPPHQPDPAEPPPRQVVLEVLHGKRKNRHALAFRGVPLVVGRGDETVPVDVDVSGYDALELGVSRQHAALSVTERGVFVEDKSSTNGTRINGFQLPPARPYRLRNGDEIEFGQLRTIIRFIQ